MSAISQKVSAMDTLPAPLLPTDLIYVIRQGTAPYDFKATPAGEFFSVITGTYAEILALVNGADLIPTFNYYISDLDILLTAATVDSFFSQGTWYHDTQLKSFGSIIYSGVAGSTGVVSVNGTAISTSVAFTTDLATTMTALAANINAFQSTYNAYAIGRAVVIEADVVGTAANGRAITTTASGGLTTAITNMANGLASTTLPLSIEYDFLDNRIYSAYDPAANIRFDMSSVVIEYLTYNPILNFRWGDKSAIDTDSDIAESAFVGCVISNSDFTNCFFTDNSFFAGSLISESSLKNSLWVSTSFGVAQIESASIFNDTVFNDCDFNRSIISSTSFEDGYFNNCYLRGSRMIGCDYEATNIQNWTAENVNFYDYDAMAGLTITNAIDCSGSVITTRSYELSLSSPTLTGLTGLGLINVAIPLFVIPNKFFASQCIVQAAGLTSGGSATLKAGIASDAADCLLPATGYATLNSNKVISSDPQSATAIRQLTATPEAATIDGGSFRVWVSGKIGI